MTMRAWFRRRDWSALAELAVLGAVLAIAALVSYTHLRDVWIAAGSPWPDLGPLLVDGLFAAAWLRMRRRRRQGDPVGVLAWLALGLALVATLAGNVAAAIVSGHTSWLSIVVAAWPALAFALVWELVTGHGRKPAALAPEVEVWWPADAADDEDERLDYAVVRDAGAESGDELLDRARVLVADGAGRPTVAKELAITDYEARRLVERVKASTNGVAV